MRTRLAALNYRCNSGAAPWPSPCGRAAPGGALIAVFIGGAEQFGFLILLEAKVMGDERADLARREAIEKIRHIASGEIAMVHTFEGRELGIVRPMATAGVDEDGTLWFLSRAGSPKNEQLSSEQVMQITYSLKSRSEYLVLDGRAVILRDQAKIDALWSAIDKNWFPKGKTDPSITLIQFTPKIGHYWDTKHAKMVQLLGMAVGAVTGKPTDDGIEGDLRP